MTKLSGAVAILNDRNEVVEVRNLGPTPVEVKPNVRPLKEVRPELGDGEVYSTPTFAVSKDAVTATYDKQTLVEPPSLEERVAALEADVGAMKANAVTK